MTPSVTPLHRGAMPPPPVFRHVALEQGKRWRCDWKGRGHGTVVARVDLLGATTGYDVVLDGSGDGQTERALPSQVRAVWGLHLVRT